jgi:glycosyltransferase involved in cell wall biosynthesis
MCIYEINSWDVGSTGKIMLQIAQTARKRGLFIKTCSSRFNGRKKMLSQEKEKNHIYLGTFCSFAIHYILGCKFGLLGMFSFFSTIRLLWNIKKTNCSLIHLHNLHDYSINLPLLFHFIKKNHIPVIWTLHDCWAFTGRCPYFELTKCDRWKTGCHNCPYPKNSYPQSYIDTTRMMWKLKRRWFTGIKDMTIVTPSEWLAGLVRQSYLKDYPVRCINNGIDLSVFKPTESDFRNRYGLVGKIVVLGVAFDWGVRKGLDVFVELSKHLPEKYRIVLVGTDDRVDAALPANIISIHRTQNQTELAKIYTAADVFVNPTREENYPTVNIEALACGTPVLTFKTGGSPEIINELCGSVIESGHVDELLKKIVWVSESKPYSSNNCIRRAKDLDGTAKFKEYVCLYKQLIGGNS